MIESSQEVRAVYVRLGYSPELAWGCERLLQDLKALIRAEVPDFSEFRRVLGEVQAQLERQGPPPEGEGLLREVLAAGEDRDRALALLNRAPVDEPLVFVEQLPFHKDGQLIWRTPADLSVIRKRPSDPARFAGLLRELEALVQSADVPRDERLGREILEGVSRLRRDLQRENAYFPTALKALEKRVFEWASHAPGAAAGEMKGQLDGLLGDLLFTRREYGPDGGRATEGQAALFKEAAQGQAKRYLDSPWMQTPWLTACVLTNLIDSELASLPPRSRRPSPADALRVIREEVAAAQYDGDENIRRLQQQEERGLYVHSLVYALLRLHRASSASPDQKV